MNTIEKYKDLTSFYSNAVIAIFLLALILMVLPLETVSKFTAWFAQFPVILLLCIVSTKTYLNLSETGSPEHKIWRLLMLATYAVFVAEMFFVIANFAQSTPLHLISAIFKLLSYTLFIIGLWSMAIHVRERRQTSNYLIPSLALFAIFALVGYLLFKEFTLANSSGLVMWSFIGFLVPDFFLIVVAMTVVVRTYGGKLSPSYMMLGVGCLFLVLYHIVGSFLVARSVVIFDHPVQLLLICAMTALAIGSDIRLKLEIEMRKF